MKELLEEKQRMIDILQANVQKVIKEKAAMTPSSISMNIMHCINAFRHKYKLASHDHHDIVCDFVQYKRYGRDVYSEYVELTGYRNNCAHSLNYYQTKECSTESIECRVHALLKECGETLSGIENHRFSHSKRKYCFDIV